MHAIMVFKAQTVQDRAGRMLEGGVDRMAGPVLS